MGPTASDSPELSVVIATRDRHERLARTLDTLPAALAGVAHETIVVDNGSSDGTRDLLERRSPAIRTVRLEENVGVQAYNTGAERARSPHLLVLDDDACPDGGAVSAALDRLAADPRLGGVALHPRHPRTGRSEWSFARPGRTFDRWPMLIAGFVMRADVWDHLGGFEPTYFLYANDTDLALRVLRAGWGVHFDPALVVWHDTETAARRPERWFRLASRNRIWTARRHTRGPSLAVHTALVLAETHARAAWRPSSHRAALRGALEGIMRRPVPLPTFLSGTPGCYHELVRARLGRAPAPLATAPTPHTEPTHTGPNLSPPAEPECVTAIVPAFGRQHELDALLGDLRELETHSCTLRVVVVDNGSEPPLRAVGNHGISLTMLRLETNVGGSGGFNAGMRHALRDSDPPDMLLLLDSDTRLKPNTLQDLLAGLRHRPGAIGIGPALRDPQSGVIYECGGMVDRVIGHYRPARTDEQRSPDYLAACCALIRCSAVRQAGLMHDSFLNGDDVAWGIRLQRTASAPLLACDRVVVDHPSWSRFPGPARYYAARNAFEPIDELTLGPRVRFVRACLAGAHAVHMHALGFNSLGDAVLNGLHAALRRERGPRSGPSTHGTQPELQPPGSLAAPDARVHPAARSDPVLRARYAAALTLDPEPADHSPWRWLRGDLLALLRRPVLGPRDTAIVTPVSWPTGWMRGRDVVAIAGDGYVQRRTSVRAAWRPMLRSLIRAALLALRLACRRPRPLDVPHAPPFSDAGGP